MSKEVSQEIVDLLADNNLDVFFEFLSKDIVFTAASPGRTWHGIGFKEAKKALQDFFSPDEIITRVIRVEHFDLPGRYRVSYRLQGEKKNEGPFEYEHQAYYQMEDQRISRLRILCSGLYTPNTN